MTTSSETLNWLEEENSLLVDQTTETMRLH